MATIVLLFMSLFFGLFGYSSSSYCVCKDGVDNSILQKTIDYACGAGADCTAILQNGACYNPNTVKSHCDYAANNYFQSKGQVPGSCDFSGAATVTATLPSTVSTGCTYPASPSQATSTSAATGAPTTTVGGTTTGGTPTSTSGGVYGGGIGLGAPTSFTDPNSSDGFTLQSDGSYLTFLIFSVLMLALWG